MQASRNDSIAGRSLTKETEAGSRLGFGGKFDNLPFLKLNEISLLPGARVPGWVGVAADALACQTVQQIPHTNIPAN